MNQIPFFKMEVQESNIAQFYKGRSIFITGATGFLGQAILQKLLHSCPQVLKVYVLIRPKRGEDINIRITKLREDNVFDVIRNSNPELLEKLMPISGDVTSTQLGISGENWKVLCDEVSVVIHSAATIKLTESLRVAINLNVKGTQRVIDFCKALKNLQALVHVSTAYANCDKTEIQEVIYPLPISVGELLKKIDLMTETDLEEMTKALIHGKPNTYIYAKAMAENILREQAGILPITIVRPSIVTGAWKEPSPGWVSGMNGPVGIMTAWGKGLLRTVICDKSKVTDWIPVDFCVNMILVAGYQTGKNGALGIPVVNCCSGTRNPITWGQIHSTLTEILASSPSKISVRAPHCSFTKSKMKNSVRSFLTEAVPVHLADAASRLQGKKIRILKFYNKINATAKSMEFFSTNDWSFATDNMYTSFMELSEVDKEVFYLDVKEINWEKYLQDYWTGIQRYILKEI